MHTVQINDHTIEADEFAWDECHKIYVVTNQESRDTLESYDYDFWPVADLPKIWDTSCMLRFINSADLTETYVPQGFEGTVRITITE